MGGGPDRRLGEFPIESEALKHSKSVQFRNNLTHAFAVNVDRISPGPFFSGL